MNADRLDWFEAGSQAPSGAIEDVERTLRLAFPADYREFAARYQGGSPIQTDFDFDDNGVNFTGSVGAFLSVDPVSDLFLLKVQNLISDRLPEAVVPIAEGPGGDYVCLDYRESQSRPPVVYWHHERSGLGSEFSWVAEAFSEFLEMLYAPDEAAEEELD